MVSDYPLEQRRSNIRELSKALDIAGIARLQQKYASDLPEGLDLKQHVFNVAAFESDGFRHDAVAGDMGRRYLSSASGYLQFTDGTFINYLEKAVKNPDNARYRDVLERALDAYRHHHEEIKERRAKYRGNERLQLQKVGEYIKEHIGSEKNGALVQAFVEVEHLEHMISEYRKKGIAITEATLYYAHHEGLGGALSDIVADRTERMRPSATPSRGFSLEVARERIERGRKKFQELGGIKVMREGEAISEQAILESFQYGLREPVRVTMFDPIEESVRKAYQYARDTYEHTKEKVYKVSNSAAANDVASVASKWRNSDSKIKQFFGNMLVDEDGNPNKVLGAAVGVGVLAMLLNMLLPDEEDGFFSSLFKNIVMVGAVVLIGVVVAQGFGLKIFGKDDSDMTLAENQRGQERTTRVSLKKLAGAGVETERAPTEYETKEGLDKLGVNLGSVGGGRICTVQDRGGGSGDNSVAMGGGVKVAAVSQSIPDKIDIEEFFKDSKQQQPLVLARAVTGGREC